MDGEHTLVKHPGGRPTKYIPEIIYPKIEEYLSSCGREQTQLPTVEGLALHLGINRDTVFAWAKEHPEISDYLKQLADTQKNQLMNDGMYGGKEVNAAMAIFLLKAIHGLKEPPTVMQQFNIGNDSKIEFIEDINANQSESLADSSSK